MRRRQSPDDIGWLYVWQPGGYWLRFGVMRREQFVWAQTCMHRTAFAFAPMQPCAEPPELVRC